MNRLLFFILSFVLLATQTIKAQEENTLPADASTSQQEQQEPEITSVSVDGIQYSIGEFVQRFGDQQPLHWVVDPEAEAQGMLVAFTTEENRDATYGIQPLAKGETIAPEGIERGAERAARNYPTLYEHIFYRGRKVIVGRNIPNLPGFNDKASSVQGNSFGSIRYEHVNYSGCSLYVQANKQIPDLGGHRRCSIFRGWNDAASSVKLVR